MKKIFILLFTLLFSVSFSQNLKLSEYPDSVVTLNDSSLFDVSRYNGPGSFTSAKMRALRIPPYILKGWTFDVDSNLYPISARNLGITGSRPDTIWSNVQGIGAGIDASAIVDITSTTKGLLISRMTAIQRLAIGTPATGLLVFDTDSAAFFCFVGSWSKLAAGTGVGDMLKAAYDANNDSTVNNSDSLNSQPATFYISDSSWVAVQHDTIKAFNNTNIQVADSFIINNPLIINSAQTLLKGSDATSGNFGLKVQDNVGSDLFAVRNDGNVGIGTETPANFLDVRVTGAGNFGIIVGRTNINALLASHNTLGGHLSLRNISGTELVSINGSGDDFFNTGKNLILGANTGAVNLLTVIASSGTQGIVVKRSGGSSEFLMLSHAITGGYFSLRDISNIELVRFNSTTAIDQDAIKTGRDLGINTLTPRRQLDVFHASSPQLRLTQTDDVTYADFKVDTDKDLIINVDGRPNQLVLDSSGNVGINTATPSEKLEVNGNVLVEDTLYTDVFAPASENMTAVSDTGIIDLTVTTSFMISDGTGDNDNDSIWMGDGVLNQIKYLAYKINTDGSDSVEVHMNLSGGASIIFESIEAGVTLIFDGINWNIMGSHAIGVP